MSHRPLLALLICCSCIGTADMVNGGDGTADMTASFAPWPVTYAPGSQPPAAPRDSGTVTPPDAGPSDPCASVQCGNGAHCSAGACTCNPGFIADAGLCIPGDPGIPSQRSEAQVCDAFRRGSAVVDNMPFTKTTAACDPGTLSRAGIDDALNRLNMFRYLAGLGPTGDEATGDANAQACALMSAWNPAGPQAHAPPPTATCYTPGGAGGAGSSNIAWGCRSPASAIDQWIDDWGNETTFGHRRWLLNPPLGPVGFGYYEGGNNYGSASCITVFGGSGTGPRPAFIAWPSPGFVPIDLAGTTWTVQGDVPLTDAGITVTGATGTDYPSALYVLQGNYGNTFALRIDRNGWMPRAGETYRVVITGEQHAPITWDVKPIACP